ncbi:hypothetical protein M0R45_005060 [Rubus argutus]|uniref:Transmembrane protein n=1 Tax=Rubus argutus TaxID=59490 RepID=A0AAW1YLI5_RUBAR
MSLTCQQLLANSPPRFTLYITSSLPKIPNLFSLPITSRPHFPISNHNPPKNPHNLSSFNSHHHSRLRACESDGTLPTPRDDEFGDTFNLDYFLSIAEFLCLSSSAVVSIGFALNSALPSAKNAAFLAMGNRVLASGALALVMAVGIGAWIRRRQWRRVCRESVKGGMDVNLFERIEKSPLLRLQLWLKRILRPLEH